MTRDWGIEMMACFAECRRLLRGKMFWAAVLLTVFALWTELGSEIYWLLHGAQLSFAGLAEKALTGEGSLLSLPLLAALPSAALARQELSGGAVSAILFRCGRAKYLISRFFSVLFGALFSQAVGILLFMSILTALLSPEPFSAALLGARMLSSAIFALAGGFAALLTKDAVSACAVPVVLCFSCSMLQARFWTEAVFLDPLSWLKGESFLFPTALLISFSLLYLACLSREVKRYV